MSDLDTALARLHAQADDYALYSDYYNGAHRLAFVSEKFRSAFGARFAAFADNLCPAVVDAVVDRLVVTGFQVVGAVADADPRLPQLPELLTPADAGPEPPDPAADVAEDRADAPPDPADVAWDLWQANHLAQQGGEVYQEAAIAGNAYVIVWPDATGLPRIDPQPANQCVVQYDAEDRRRVAWGAKVWAQADGTIRATLYYADRLEKYITRASTKGSIPQDGRDFVPYAVPGEAWPLPNPYGVVPLFHFATNARLGQGGGWGRSDLADVIPLQDALNKAVCDMLVAMEFTAFPQRYVTGMQIELDEITGRPISPIVPGEDRLWWFEDPNVKLGQFDPASLDNYLKVQESLRAEIARVSGTPVHYLMLLSGHWPSGEALRIAEVRLTHKILDRCLSYGETWGAVFRLALRMVNLPDVAVTPDWQDPAPQSPLERAQELQVQQALGVPNEVLWKALGFSDAEIQMMRQLKQAAVPAPLQSPTGPPAPSGAASPNGAAPMGG